MIDPLPIIESAPIITLLAISESLIIALSSIVTFSQIIELYISTFFPILHDFPIIDLIILLFWQISQPALT